MRKTPRPHQQQALEKIIPAAKEHARFTVIMPCGTGKTMVQLWSAEALGSKTILVLLPSLSLLRQTLREWMAETKWQQMDVLCVCSDQTVSRPSEDEIMISPEDVGYPVTSDTTEIATFLSKKTCGVKLVFSTYHSSHLVAAGMAKKFSFDLGIFDEAHVTAGEADGLFSFALSQQNIRITTRSFWTATPRHYDPSKIKEDMPVVYSMDDEKVYGPRVHQLTFREAVRQGIICDYEVLVSVVTNKMLGVGAIETGEVRIKGRKVPARTVAHHMALCQATSCYGVKKIFSFHPRVSEAEEFTNGGPESAAHHLPKDFRLFHVNGAMTTALREEKIAEFREAGRALMSNARCLTQGIDVPAVDMVAFLSKKRSLIDIVQATGRAMRKAPGKTKGYILVPLFVEQGHGETLEQAVERSDFREVWAVLNAMREQDEALADTMSRIRVKKGEDEGDDESPDDDDNTIIDKITVVGPEVKVQDLRRAITTICVDRLTPNWDEMYGRLLAFRKKNGHCRVSTNSPRTNLGSWVSNQRSLYKAGKLAVARIALLEKVEFDWCILPQKEIYATWQEAGEAAKKLGIKSSTEYVDEKRYKEDEKLPCFPNVAYPQFPGWPAFLGTTKYFTWQEASEAAKRLKIKNSHEYMRLKSYKKDPRLPSNPGSAYDNFPGWEIFLTGKAKEEFYPTWQKAGEVARKLGIRSSEEYIREKRYLEDLRLPSNPNNTYSNFPGWPAFLGNKRPKKP